MQVTIYNIRVHVYFSSNFNEGSGSGGGKGALKTHCMKCTDSHDYVKVTYITIGH